MNNNPEIKKIVIPKPDFQALGGLEICKTRHPSSLELFYNLINDQAGISFPNHLRPIAYALADENIKYLLITVSPGAGKLCANSTPILTFNRGWTTHGELKVGDFVFHPSGKPIKILATIPQNEPASLNVEFTDGSIIKVHPNHEWTVHDYTSQKWRTVETNNLTIKRNRWKGYLNSGKEGNTAESTKLIYGTPNKRGSICRYHLPLRAPLQYPKKDLSIPPYVLGAWLGDGVSIAGRLSHDYRDLEVRDKITIYYKLGAVTKHRTTGVLTSQFYGLIQELRKLNLFKNKHIPRIYLEASIEQRLELLAGLIDTDGTVNKQGQVTFSNTNTRIIEGVAELIKSFGWRAKIQTTSPKLSTSGIQGKLPVHRIKFTPILPIPTKIPRKNLNNPTHSQRRLGIKSIQQSNQPEAGMCIQVDSDDGLYLVGKNLIPTHNSLLTSVCYPIWELGLDFEKTVLGVSSAEDQMSKFLQASMGIVEHNKIYRNIYPNSVPDKAAGWCFLPDTQVLTRRGWLHFYELNKTDEIATRNPENHKFEWQKPLEITCQDYSGEIINFNSRCIDLAVTPNHRMIVTDRKFQKSEKMIFADELAKRKHSAVPITSLWSGIEIKNVEICSKRTPKTNPDSIGRKGMSPGKPCKQHDLSGDDYCALLGMYLSEGSTNGQAIGITQFKKSKGFKPYLKIINKIFSNFYRYDKKKGTFYIGSKSLVDHVKQFGHLAPDKFVPELIKNSTPRQIQIFLKYYRLGDGCIEKNGGPKGNTKSSRFYTTSYRMAGDLQELCQKAGWSSSVRKRIKTKDAIFPNKITKAENLLPIYTVREHFKKESNSPKNYLWVNKHKKFDYSGKVYCATVPNGTLYIRRNGFAVWTGNSPFRGMFIKRRVKGNPDPSYSISGLFCYDDKTEVLTKHGWVLLKDVSNTDQVATRQLNTKKFEWQTPTELHHYNYSGSMINVHANAIDLVVTPNHNLLVKTHGKEPNELLIEAQNVAKIGKYLRIPTDSIWSGNPITIKYFGDYKKRTKIKKERAETVFELYKRGDSYRKIGKKVGLTNSQIFKIINRITTYESSPKSGLDVEMSGDDYCAFMGMYLSEGSCDKSFIHITQFKTSAAWPIYKEKLEQIFGSVYYSNDVNGNFIIGRTAIIPFLRQFGKAQTKFIPDDIMDATPEQQRIFWYYYRLGDGTKQYKKALNNHDGYESIATSSQKMADQLQELAQKMGRCANVYTLITKPHYFKEHLIKGGNLHYRVQLHTSKTRQFKLKSIDYTGNVYCVSVPNQTLYVRRNGKAAWCGNSQSITGKHAQIILGDDIEDKKYSESEHMLNQLEEAFYKTLLGRRDPRGARIVLVGRRWDINDLYHRLEISGDWVVMCLPSIRENAPNVDPNLYYDITIPANLPCVFNNFAPATETTIVQAYYGYEPSGFYWQEQPSKADEAKMARKNAPAIYQTVYQSKPELSEMAIFKDDDFAFYAAPEDLHLGASSDIVKRLLNRAALVVQSWDTAFTADSKNDASVCYSEDTEVLTNQGWKFFKNLNRTEKIATLNPITKEIEYHLPTEYQRNFYEGELINLTSPKRVVDLLVTPEHNIWAYTSTSKKRGILKAYSADSLNRIRIIPRTGIWIGEAPEYFELPSYQKSWYTGRSHQTHCNFTKNTQKIPTEVWISFLGLYLSEGSINKEKNRVEISQHGINKNKMAVMLSKLPFEISKCKNGFYIYNAQLANYLSQFGKSSEKYVPEFVKQLTPKLINTFLNAYVLGDGAINKSGGRRIYTTSLKMVDDLQELFFKSGTVASFGINRKAGSKIKIKNRKETVTRHTVYQILERKTRTEFVYNKNRNGILPKIAYKGYVYDVTVQNHIIYVRRNGKSLWSGNCYTAALISCNQNHRMLLGETSTITDFHYDVYVLDEFIAKLEFADLTPQAEELFEKWNPDKILVEKGATGIPLVQHLTKIAAPVEGIAVNNVSKRQRALNGAKAGSAQGWMRSWRVKFPKDATWFPDTKREFIKFTGAKGQRDDRVDALVQIINFTIDYGISAQEMPEGWRTDEEIDAQIRSWNNPQSSIDSFIDNIKTYYNPMIGLCQTCKHFSQNYCKYHKLNVSALHSCSNYDSKDEVSEWQTINLK